MLLFAVASCGRSGHDAGTCDRARDLYLANAKSEIDKLMSNMPARGRQRADSAAAAEIQKANERFPRACDKLGAGKILDCARRAKARREFNEECQAVYENLQKVLYDVGK